MMRVNLLTDTLPDWVEVCGARYSINSDFRTFVKFETLIHDSKIGGREKIEQILKLVYVGRIPADIEKAVNAIIEFYRCGEEKDDRRPSPKKNGNVEIKPKRIYDLEQDAQYIFGAFMSEYGIDLNAVEQMHWWKFQALFRSLGEHNKIVEIMGYRAADLNTIKDKKERERIAKLKRIYALKETKTQEEKVAMIGAAFGGGFR